MDLLISFLNILLPIFYASALFLYGLHFFRSDRWASRHMSRLLKTTVAVHFAEILMRGLHFGHFPSANIYEMATVVALAISLIYLYIEQRIKLRSSGFFILIVPFLLQIFSSAFINLEKEIPPILKSPLFILHTTTAILGYAALMVSALYGVLYLMLFYNLKSAQFGIVYRKMSSLEELSEMNTRAAMLGFLFLSIAILLGILWKKSAFPEVTHFDPKVIATYLIWSIYGMILYGKKIGGWTGKLLAYISIGGFVILILSIVIIKYFITSFHQFG